MPELYELVIENEARVESDPELEEQQRVRLRLIVADAKGNDAAYRDAHIAQERIEAETDWKQLASSGERVGGHDAYPSGRETSVVACGAKR